MDISITGPVNEFQRSLFTGAEHFKQGCQRDYIRHVWLISALKLEIVITVTREIPDQGYCVFRKLRAGIYMNIQKKVNKTMDVRIC